MGVVKVTWRLHFWQISVNISKTVQDRYTYNGILIRNSAYQMVATAVSVNVLQGHSPVAGLFKCNPSNICAAFYTISTDSVLARFLRISRASCYKFLTLSFFLYFTLFWFGHFQRFVLVFVKWILNIFCFRIRKRYWNNTAADVRGWKTGRRRIEADVLTSILSLRFVQNRLMVGVHWDTWSMYSRIHSTYLALYFGHTALLYLWRFINVRAYAVVICEI